MQEPDFNSWTVIFLIGALNGFFLAYIIVSNKKGDKQPNRILSFLVLLFSITLIYYVGFWTNTLQFVPRFTRLILNFAFLFGPVIYIYFRSLKEDIKFSDIILHFLPFVVISIYKIPVLFEINQSWAISFREFYFGIKSNLVITILQNIHLVVYTIMLFLFLQRENDLNTTNRSFLKKLSWFFAGFTLSFASYYVLVATHTLRREYDYIISLAMMTFIYFIGYSGYRYPQMFENSEIRQVDEKYKKSGLTPRAMDHYAVKLKDLMDSRKPFIKSDLKLQDLAALLDISPHHLSHVINGKLNKNFSDFVNSYRIKEAETLLRDPAYKNSKIIHIAYDSGFNTKVSFNQTFKKFTGKSPSEYRKEVVSSKRNVKV